MQALGNVSANANGNAAATCYTKQTTCSSMCADLAGKYDALASNCDSCASLSIYEQTAQTLRSMKQSCDGLSSRVQMLNSQALAANSSGGNGNLCNQMTEAQPQSVGSLADGGANSPQNAQLNAGDTYSCQANASSATCSGCRINPNSPYCKAILEGQSPTAGKAGFQAPEKSGGPTKSEDFNPFPTSYTDSYAQNLKARANTPSSSHTIPGDTGQGLPSPGDSGFAPITDSSNKKAVAQGTGAADILEDSLRSGSGYTYGQASVSEENGGNSGGRKPSSDNGSFFGIDLKKYLPGWATDMLPGGTRANAKQSQRAALKNKFPCTNGKKPLGCDPTMPYPASGFSAQNELFSNVPDPPRSRESKIFLPLLTLLTVAGLIFLAWMKWQNVRSIADTVLFRFFAPNAKRKKSRV